MRRTPLTARHPGPDELRAWLTGVEDPGLDRHVVDCEQCAAEIERLAGDESPTELRNALLRVLEPADDLVVRVEADVVAKLETREAIGMFTDLLSIGWETARLLFGDGTAEPDREADR